MCVENTNSKYYDGTKLLSMKDINGNTPEIYICTSNRTAGKSTFFGRLFVNSFFKKKEKFMILYRFVYELDDCANKFFKDIGGLFFSGHTMTSTKQARGTYHSLYIDGVHCGFAVSLNSADTIKKYSHLFNDVKRILFDEFQSETNHYCADEVKKLQSIHTSVARGNGEMVRYVPVYMVSNPVSILNPYYVAMNISARLTRSVKFLKGKGFVLEQGHNENAENAQKNSGFNQAFESDEYLSYSAEGVYLNDNASFVEKITGNSKYICTLRFEGRDYAIREFAEQGVIYCDDRPDKTHLNRVSVTTEDHQINYVMLKQNNPLIIYLRYLFERGAFRFKDLRCKDVVLKTLSY